MPDPYSAGITFIWEWDGFKNDSAPGESWQTSYGITEMTWATAVQDGTVSGSFADMTADQAKIIYAARYYAPFCHLLPGVAFSCFVEATLTGVGHTARLLQRIVHVTQDAVVGPHTEAAALAYGQTKLINAIVAADKAYLASLASAPRFLRGWTRREESMRQRALQIAGLAVT